MSVNYKDARPIYEQVKSGLRQMITGGELPSGAKLPSVRDLAVSLTVNPNTIQRAYRELEAEGWIQSAQGKGSFVSERAGADLEELRRGYAEFDLAVRKLLSIGAHPKDLCARILNGGEEK